MAAKVVVVTGASSGIGRETARALVTRGDNVVLVARRADALHDLADECRDLPGRMLVAPADVTDEAALSGVAGLAAEEFGRIDAWVNAAAVWSYGRFEDTPAEVFRGILETTFLGSVHGARAVLPVFRAQGRGVLVNVASIYGHLTTPYVGPYVAAKWALVGWSHVLRQEVRDAPGIEVSVVSPGAVDTPIYRDGANYVGRGMRPLPPVLPPRRVVRAVLRAVDRPRREVVVGRVQRVGITAQRWTPALYDRLVGPAVDHLALQRSQKAPDPGNVFEPSRRPAVSSGGWRRHDRAKVAQASSLGLGVAAAAGLLRSYRSTAPGRAPRRSPRLVTGSGSPTCAAPRRAWSARRRR